MEKVDDGVIYIDVMSWLLQSPSQDGSEDEEENERMLENLCQLIVHLRLALIDQLILAILHSPRLWSIRIRERDIPATDKDRHDKSMQNKAIEPFLSIFHKLKLAFMTKFHRSSSSHSSHSNYPSIPDGPNRSGQNPLQLKPSTLKFIDRWRVVTVETANKKNLSREAHFIPRLDLRQLCLLAVLLVSIKSTNLGSTSSHLSNLIQQDCIKFIKRSIHQTQSATSNLQAITPIDPDSVITWLAVQIIPSINPINLAQSSTHVINNHLAKSLFRVFESGHLFDQLSTSLDMAPHALTLHPSSSTHEGLKRISNDPLAQVVLSISLSISKLIEHTTKTSDSKFFSANLRSLVAMTEKVHESWRTATSSYERVYLPEFMENSISIDNLKPEENQVDRWLRNIFFCCLLILGGLVNKLAIRSFSNVMAELLFPPMFQILCQIHFITLRFTSDKLSTHTAVFDTLVGLTKPSAGLTNLIVKECQPSLIASRDVRDPVRISRVIYYFNLIERFTGSVIQEEYLDQTVVPFIWAFIDRVQVGFHAHLALSNVLEFCSKDTVLNLADKYFEILLHDISLDQSSVLSFDQQKSAWKNLLKAVSIHSRSTTESLTTKLIQSIKMLDEPIETSASTPMNNSPTTRESVDDEQQMDKRKRLYKLLISQIGELRYDETEEETSKFLDTCWDLIRFQDDLVELFEVGLNQQSFKISHPNLSNFGVLWWHQKIKSLNSSPSPKL